MMSNETEFSQRPNLRNRFLTISLVAASIFFLLFCRLWYLQVINAGPYARLSEQNRIRYLPIEAPRGPIYDRDGQLLVDNRPSFDVTVMRPDVEQQDALLAELSAYLETDVETLQRRWREGRRYPAYRPVVLAADVGRETIEQVQENAYDLSGVFTRVRPVRHYPHQDLAAHLLGYLGEITEEELKEKGEEGYRAGDFLGKSGVELLLEPYLHGLAGQRRMEVDVKGKEMRLLQVEEFRPGNKVYLTLDLELQKAAEQALGDRAGAVVVLDVKTGEVLALVSRPAFNPDLFARGISEKEWRELVRNPLHPLQDKTIKGQYPPGSTFKMMTALAALEAGVATPHTAVDCQGSFTLGNAEFRCWKKRGHGKTDLEKAIRESCDIWFYQVSLDLGIERLAALATAFGLGSPLDFPLKGEKGGMMPDKEWKRRRFNAPWYRGETVIAAIGQGYVLATPLQLGVMTAALANGGTVFSPQVIKRVESWEGETLLSGQGEILNRVELDPRNLEAVREGMVEAVNAPRGTGRACRLPGITVAGKTGTAQVVRRKSDEEEEKQQDEKIPYRFRDHALFTAFAPAEAPEIAVAVVVEHGEHGSSAAAPVARAVFEQYFGLTGDDDQTIEEVVED